MTPDRTSDHTRTDRQVCVRVALCLGRGWDRCHAAIADATLGDITIGEVPTRLRLILESGHLHAGISSRGRVPSAERPGHRCRAFLFLLSAELVDLEVHTTHAAHAAAWRHAGAARILLRPFR